MTVIKISLKHIHSILLIRRGVPTAYKTAQQPDVVRKLANSELDFRLNFTHICIHDTNNTYAYQLRGSIATDYTQNTPNGGLFTEMACYNWPNRLAGMRSIAVGV